ncbi:MAG: hypothetical protein INR66_03625 [Gordonia polyisoprenivorans]|nr:hypothetical protein [Gordonia polyisoprenivorans]
MKHPLNLPLLLDEIAGYTKADQLIGGVLEPHRGAVAQRLVEGYAATPTSPFEHGFRLRLDDAARATPNP